MGLYRTATATALILLFLAGPALAQNGFFAVGEDKVRLDFGVFFTDNDTTVRVDETDGDLGTTINLEDLLGLDSDVFVTDLGGYWRLARRHRLFVHYYSIDRDATHLATEDIDFGDIVLEEGTTAQTIANIKVVPFSYGWSFIQKEKTEIAFLIGGHWLEFDLAIGSQELMLRAQAKANGPLPLLGLNWEQTYGQSRRWRSVVSAQLFDIDFDAFNGKFSNIRVAGEYHLSRHFLLGLAYNWFAMDVKVEDDAWRGRLEWEYQGVQLYGSLRF